MGFYNNKKLALTRVLPPSGSGGLTWYQRSPSVASVGLACASVTLINCRIDTTGNVNPFIPEVGNIVYNNLSGTTLFDGNDLFYVFVGYIAALGDPIYYCQVENNTGVILSVLEITGCTPPL